jgi:hypothetical protein
MRAKSLGVGKMRLQVLDDHGAIGAALDGEVVVLQPSQLARQGARDGERKITADVTELDDKHL